MALRKKKQTFEANHPEEIARETERRHDAASTAREAGYFDPESGKFVLTSWFLLSQGRCCGKGCRHCPWPDGP